LKCRSDPIWLLRDLKEFIGAKRILFMRLDAHNLWPRSVFHADVRSWSFLFHRDTKSLAQCIGIARYSSTLRPHTWHWTFNHSKGCKLGTDVLNSWTRNEIFGQIIVPR
jgi:hypothetical protein